MACDEAVDSAALDGALTGIANAIRYKTGGTGKLTLEGMAAAIAGAYCPNGARITDAEAVRKSYPSFFEDYRSAGGLAYVV